MLYSGRTALHSAASGGHRFAIETLLAAGAQPDAYDKYGQQPKDLALHAGHEQLFAMLDAIAHAHGRSNRVALNNLY